MSEVPCTPLGVTTRAAWVNPRSSSARENDFVGASGAAGAGAEPCRDPMIPQGNLRRSGWTETVRSLTASRQSIPVAPGVFREQVLPTVESMLGDDSAS
jgi:hypothetical protein